MAFLEFFKNQKDQKEISTNLNKSSSEQSVFNALYSGNINKNVAKLFSAGEESAGKPNMTHHQTGKLLKKEKVQEKAIISQDKRNSKSEENIFEKFDIGKITKSTSKEAKEGEDDDDDQKIVVNALRNRFKFRNSSDDLNPTSRRSNSLEDQNNSSSASVASATSSTEFLEEHTLQQHAINNKMMTSPGVMTDAQGLIVPKKLVNPCLESQSHQSLHRELMFNQKVGKTVLNQKSELQRALEKQKERQLLAAQTQQKKEEQSIENELNKVIMQRAARLENSQKENNKQNELDNFISPEYLNARAKLKHTIDTK